MKKYYELKMGKLLSFTTKLVYTCSFLPVVIAAFYAWTKLTYPAPFPYDPFSVASRPIPWAALPIFLVIPVVVMLFRGLAPDGYVLNDVQLIIDRKFKPIVIPLMEITEVRLLTDEELRWTVKLSGSEGFYGYFGVCWNKKLGIFKMYATRRKNLVAVRTAKTLYALSPEDIEDFLTTLKNLTGR
ncbi:MAG: PH domain-containing protein [Elusimicrobia bacterium]|nr:PH domain-containing protein [Elusimicrobiota bacterium]